MLPHNIIPNISYLHIYIIIVDKKKDNTYYTWYLSYYSGIYYNYPEGKQDTNPRRGELYEY